ncbi:DUF4017 family protein [Neobacillus soli]|uniref:DUF4017 family protein n=1 Tax=Neobacillus soli TaxID=220688 RepID=UPI0008243AD7|nr:DUF4017 family protein [Neobacillus soli]
MNKWTISMAVYVIVCVIAVFSKASEGYDVWSWKLLVGQVFAIPLTLIVFATLHFKSRHSGNAK